MTYQDIVKQIDKKQFKNIYFLFGEEEYFIDKLSNLLEAKVLDGVDPGFNSEILYGAEVNANEVVRSARNYPMMAQWRLVMLKEAQRMKKDELEKLASYFEKPVPSTVLVVVFRDKKKPVAKLEKPLKEQVIFESKMLYDYQIRPYIETLAKERDLRFEADAMGLLIEYLGTNLQWIDNELTKIELHFKNLKERVVKRDLIYELVNIDKEFNVFELINELGARNKYKTQLIISQMLKNIKENPPIVIINQLFNFYAKLASLNQKKANSEALIMKELGVAPFIAKRWLTAVQSHPEPLIRKNILLIQETDLELKGIKTTNMGEEHLLKTLILRLIG